MRKVIALSLLQVKLGLRQKAFWLSALVFLLLLLCSGLLGELSIGEKEVVLRNLTLSSIEITGLFLIVFGLVYNFYRQKESRLQEVYLTYFSPAVYLAGTLLGYCIVCALFIFLSVSLTFPLLLLQDAFTFGIFTGCLAVFMKLSLFCGICLVIAVSVNYPILASLLTLGAYAASEFAFSAVQIVKSGRNEFFRSLFDWIYHILPMADAFDIKYAAIYNAPVDKILIFEVFLYVAVYLVFLFFLTLSVFRRREC